jgi:hypothetical protein
VATKEYLGLLMAGADPATTPLPERRSERASVVM